MSPSLRFTLQGFLKPWVLVLGCFLTGAVNQGSCAVWIHYSEAGNSLGVAVSGMVEAITLLLGINQAIIEKRKIYAATWVLGYGLGPALVVYGRSLLS